MKKIIHHKLRKKKLYKKIKGKKKKKLTSLCSSLFIGQTEDKKYKNLYTATKIMVRWDITSESPCATISDYIKTQQLFSLLTEVGLLKFNIWCLEL